METRALTGKVLSRVSLVVLLVTLILNLGTAAYADTPVSGTLSVNTTWASALSPYLVTGDVTVPAGMTLTIDSGVVVNFQANRKLIVSGGTLDAPGTSGNEIIFTSSTQPGTPGDWSGITVEQAGSVTLRHCRVEYGSYGIYGSDNSSVSVEVENSTISNNSQDGIYLNSANVSISGSTIANNGYWGIYLYNSASATLSSNQITDNGSTGIYINYQSSSGSITGNTISGNGGSGIECYDATPSITGNIITSNYTGISCGISNSQMDPTQTISSNTVTDNGWVGVYLYGNYTSPTFRNNNLYANTTYDLANYTLNEIDCQNNWWGTTAFDEMEAGGNPKNISTIYDFFDNSSYGVVNYSGWLNTVNGTPTSSTHNGAVFLTDLPGSKAYSYILAETVYIEVRDADLDVDPGVQNTVQVRVTSPTEDTGTPASATDPVDPGNTGDGTVGEITTSYTTFAEDWTLECIQGGASARFSVTAVAGSDTRVHLDAFTGQRYTSDYGEVSFLITGGTSAFVVGDKFTFSTTAAGVVAEQVTLAETGVNTGVFRGSIALDESGAVGADGNLDVSRGDTITVIYDDSANDWGDPAKLVDRAIYVATLVSGTLSTNTTWTLAGSPYMVTGDVTVPVGVTLTIESGVTVLFLANQDDQQGGWNTNNTELIVSGGTLNAVGTVDEPIVFTSSAQQPEPGDWYGIRVESNWTVDSWQPGSATLQHCRVEYGSYGVSGYQNSSVEVRDSTISNNWQDGIYLDFSNGTISNNTITNNGYEGIRAWSSSSATISSNQITNNGWDGIYFWSSSGSISNNTISANGNYGIWCDDATPSITGNSVTANNAGGIYINIWDPAADPTQDISFNTVTANSGDGITLNGYASPTIHNNNLYDNGSYDLVNYTPNEIDCRNNWWWNASTADMGAGGNPKDIATIFDFFDNPYYGAANYSGWLSASTVFDSDGDGMGDDWELTYFGNLDRDGTLDWDGDGLTDLEEFQHATDPKAGDTDSDGMPDGWEVDNWLNPRTNDSDQDGDGDWLSNSDEYQNNTHPDNSDTDADGLSDGAEVNTYNTNPNNPDSDNDGISDGQEIADSTDPNDPASFLLSISGTVTEASAGTPITNVRVNVHSDDTGFKAEVWTDADGEYSIRGLASGCYELNALPPSDSDYIISARQEVYLAPQELKPGVDFALESGGFTVSGTVSADTVPQANVDVIYNNNILEIHLSTQTDGTGYYELTNLPAGEAEIGVQAPGPSPPPPLPPGFFTYLSTGADIDLIADLPNFNFDLEPGACAFGRVVDNGGRGIQGIRVSYWSDFHNAHYDSVTDVDGGFALCYLPPGIGTVNVQPEPDMGFCETADRYIHMDSGVNKNIGLFELQQCALVQGRVHDTSGNPLSGLEVQSNGVDFEADADVCNGTYQIRLPEGTHSVFLDTRGSGPHPLVANPVEVIVGNVDWGTQIAAPDITVYSSTDSLAGTITGNVSSSGPYPTTGELKVELLPAGIIGNVKAETLATIQDIQGVTLEDFGPYTLDPVPQGTYDAVCILQDETDEGLERVTGLGVQRVTVTQGSTVPDTIDFQYDPANSATVSGNVLDDYSSPVLGARVLITNQVDGSFAAFAETDENGYYEINYLPADINYKVQASHPLYAGAVLDEITPTVQGPNIVDLSLTSPSVSGTITYTYQAALEGKNLIIWGSPHPSFSSHSVFFIQKILDVDPEKDGIVPYSLSLGSLPPIPLTTRGYLYYFIDVNDNGQPDLGEPFGYQGYEPGSSHGYEQFILDLESKSNYADVNVVLQEASLDPLWFNIFYEQRPNDPGLVVSYQPYAPFTAISSVTVNGDELSAHVDITSSRDEWHEYWRRIGPDRFDNGVIPEGVHTYTIHVVATDGASVITENYTDHADIGPLPVPELLTPSDGSAVTPAPTFQWNRVDGAVRYRVEIWPATTGSWVYEGFTTDLSHTVTGQGILIPGESYRCRVTAFGPEDPADGYYSWRSRCDPITIFVVSEPATPPAPSFAWADVKSEIRAGPGGDPELWLALGAMVLGPSPADTGSLTITWPDGITKTALTQAHFFYDSSDGTAYYWRRVPMPEPKPEGVFAFEVENSAGSAQVDVPFSYTPVPIVDISSMTETPGDGTYTGSATPTFTWAPVSIDGKTTYYQVEIYDWSRRHLIYESSRDTATSFTVPAGVLPANAPLWLRVQAGDSDQHPTEKNRSRTDFLPVYTGNRQPPVFDWRAVRSDNRTDGMRFTIGVGLSLGVLPTEVNNFRVSSPQNGIDYFFSENDLWYYPQLQTYEAWFGQGNLAPQDDTVTYNLSTTQGSLNRSRGFTYSPVPIVDIGTLLVDGQSLENNAYVASTTPTFSWDPITVSVGTPHYRLEIHDWRARDLIYVSPHAPTPSATVPPNTLLPGGSYRARIRTTDAANIADTDNISRSDWFWFTVTLQDLWDDTDGDEVFDPFDNCPSTANPTQLDTDSDGLGDFCDNCVDIYNPRQEDTDSDGLGNDCESQYGNDPANPDSDGDGLNDGDEVNTHGTDPTNPDSDGDGYSDGKEVTQGSDPLLGTSIPWLTWTGAADTSWHVAENWDPAIVPSDGDNVLIPYGTPLAVYSTGVTNLKILTCNGNLTVTGGTLNLEADSTIGPDGILRIQNSSTVLGGSGKLTIRTIDTAGGLFRWRGGRITGSGSFEIQPGADLNIEGSSSTELDGRTIYNEGTITWTGNYPLRGSNGAVINNYGTFDIRTDQHLMQATGDAPVFNNDGTMLKTFGSSTSQIDWLLTNSGTLDLKTGGVKLNQDGTHSGIFAVQDGATLWFGAGTHTLDPDSTMTCAGILNVTQGTTNFNGVYNGTGSAYFSSGTAIFNNAGGTYDTTATTIQGGTVKLNAGSFATADMTVSSGGLSIIGDLTVLGTFDWLGGRIAGTEAIADAIVIDSGASLNISGDGEKQISALSIDNGGTVFWTGAGRVVGGDAARIRNNGIFDIQNNASFEWDANGGLPGFTNNGTFIKSAGSIDGETLFDNWNLINFSTIDIQTGTVKFANASLYSTNMATLQGSGTLDVSSGDFTNEGTVRPGASPGIMTIVGNYTEAGGMGAVVIEIGGTEAGTQYDQLAVTGTATLANSLSVVLIDDFEPGYTPNPGDSFQILTYGSRSGEFIPVSLPSLPGAREWTADYGLNGLTLTVSDITVTDSDNDGVPDADDTAPLDANACRDADNDTCDDCSSGTDNPSNDGTDTDTDGLCDAGDPDDDGDGISDTDEVACGSNPLNAASTCELCDGADNDQDGAVDEGFADTDNDGTADCADNDDDNDGVPDADDTAPLDANACRDADNDTCDDCSSGTDNPSNDGTDTDADGLCDGGDPDDDGDGILDTDEVACGSNPLNAASTCELCDGVDNDQDGAVDEGFADTDNDGTADCVDNDDDNDGITDTDEATNNTDPLNPDTDADGLNDGDEVNIYNTDPNVPDTSISGTVTDASGQPITGLNVSAEDYSTGSWAGSAQTQPDGSYAITGLAEGSYRVRVDSSGTDYVSEYYDDTRDFGSATAVQVSKDQTTSGIDFSLNTGSSIEGVITDADGQPIADLWVDAENSLPGYGWRSAQTQTDGSYAITGLAEGSYRVRVDSSGTDYVSEYYDDTYNYNAATPVDVMSGQSTADINFSLALGGKISGVVTDANGQPIAGLWVHANPYSTGYVWGSAETQSDGSYVISGLPTGSYRVQVDTWDTEYVQKYYDDTYYYNLATPVDVTIGQTASGIDFGLAVGSKIEGRVTRDSDGEPISGLWVIAYDYAADFASGPVIARSAQTQPDGSYTIEGLPTGTYRVLVDTWNTDYAPEFYNNTYQYDLATLVPVTVGETTSGIDFGLAIGGSIAGVVTDSSGQPIPGLWVNAFEYSPNGMGALMGLPGFPYIPSFYGSAQTQSDGSYVITGLPPLDYRVVVYGYGTGYLGEYYDDTYYYNSASRVGVTLGSASLNIRFSLDVGTDSDADITPDDLDNCPSVFNPDQANTDGDEQGDACDPDDDNDGLLDSAETNTGLFVDANDAGTNPLNPDTDGDRLNDGDEVIAHETDPTNADTDGDEVNDGQEILDGTDPKDPYDFELPAGAAPKFTTPSPTGSDLQAMVNRQYSFTVAAEAGGGSCTGLSYYLQVDPPVNAGLARMRNFTDTDSGCDKGEVEFVPPASGSYTIYISVSDGYFATSFGSYTLNVADELKLSPETYSCFRTSTEQEHQPFEISGGTPFSSSPEYYEVEILENDQVVATDYIHEGADGKFTYTFDTTGLSDGTHFIKVKDKWTFLALSKPIAVNTITFTERATLNMAPGDQTGVLNVTDPQCEYADTTIQVHEGAAPTEGCNLYLSTVDSGGPYLLSDERRGAILRIEATDNSGEEIAFHSPVTLTIPYANLVESGDDPHDFVVTHYLEETDEWEQIIPFVDTENEILTVQADRFSHFAVVIPSNFGPFGIDGGTEVGNYVMISRPGHALVRNIRTSLEPILGPYDDKIWRLFAWDPTARDYVEITDANLQRFDDEFDLDPGHSFWLISRYDVDLSFSGLAHNDEAGASFHTLLYPGWNMVSHPWKCDVDLSTHDIQVSVDGVEFFNINADENSLTEKWLWTFKGADGSQGDWYHKISLDTNSSDPPHEAMKPHRGYWLRNVADGPVYLRMVQRNIAICKTPAAPHRLRLLALEWMQKGISATARTCYAQSGGTQPPNPPGSPGTSAASIGVVSGSGAGFTDSGGGGCFIATAAYGSPMEPQVRILLRFRDEVLLTSTIGKRLVKLYYQMSPPVSRWIGQHESARALVRLTLVPVVAFCSLWLKTGAVVHLLFLIIFSAGTTSMVFITLHRRPFRRRSQRDLEL